jgi:sulfonate transport system ATP-binding protein
MDEGRLRLDIRITLPHPRHKSSETFDELRDTLLGALGVAVSV